MQKVCSINIQIVSSAHFMYQHYLRYKEQLYNELICANVLTEARAYVVLNALAVIKLRRKKLQREGRVSAGLSRLRTVPADCHRDPHSC